MCISSSAACGCLEISRGGIGARKPAECVRRLAHQLHALFRRLDCLRMTAETTQHEAGAVKHHQVSRLVLERGSRETISLFKTARVIRTPEHRETRNDRQRIEIPAGVRFAQRFAEATFHRELERIPDARGRIVWIELNCTNEMMLSAAPGEVAAKNGLAEGNVTFGKIRIELDRGRRRFVSRRRTLGKRHHAENTEPVVIVRHSRIRERVLRIERDRLLITNDRSREAFFSKRVPVKTSAQISFVCLRIVGAAFGESQTLINGQVRHDRFGDVRGDHVFEIENIGELFVKLSGPGRRLVAHVEQLNRHANAFAVRLILPSSTNVTPSSRPARSGSASAP